MPAVVGKLNELKQEGKYQYEAPKEKDQQQDEDPDSSMVMGTPNLNRMEPAFALKAAQSHRVEVRRVWKEHCKEVDRQLKDLTKNHDDGENLKFYDKMLVNPNNITNVRSVLQKTGQMRKTINSGRAGPDPK